jgi:cell division protein FtsB
MLSKIKNNNLLKTATSTHSIGLYLFLIISLSVAWSTAKIIQKNYELQQQITMLEQQVSIQQQQNKNQQLKNLYYQTDTFLELGARKYFSKTLPGERVYVVPKSVALANTKPEQAPVAKPNTPKTHTKFIQNWLDWGNFLQGKNNQLD